MTRVRVRRCVRGAFIAWLFATGAAPVRAQNAAGDYGASFLRIPVGARLVASPEIVAGMRPDATALHANPAFLSALEHTEFYVTSSRWLGDLSFGSVGAAIPLGRGGTVLGVGTSLLYSGGLAAYDPSLNVVGEESFYDLGVDLALAHRFAASGFSVAAGATYVREHVPPEDGSGRAFHAGVAYRWGANLAHAVIRDAGGAVDFRAGSWPIAREWLFGAGRSFEAGTSRLLAGVQVTASPAYGTRLRLGVDCAMHELFTLRTGLSENLEQDAGESRVQAGFGMRLGAFAVEYAYAPQEFFASTHTFTLAYTVGARPTRGLAALVPAGDLSPPPPAPTRTPAGATAVPRDGTYLLVGGAHATLEGAKAEAQALEALAIPVELLGEGPRVRVVVGRYSSYDEAAAARTRYRARGHDFQILAR